MRSMDSILSDEPSQGAAPEATESESLSTRSELPDTDESPSETPEPEPVKTESAKAAEPAAQVADDDAEDEGSDPVDLAGFKRALAAARGDKRKMRKQWQETQKQLANLEGQLTALRQQQVKPAEEAKQPDDPELDFYGNPIGFVDKRVQTVEQQLRDFRFKTSLRAAVKAYPDFAEAEAAFVAAAQRNPNLAQQLQAHDDPAEFAYQTGKEIIEYEAFRRHRAQQGAAPVAPSSSQAAPQPPAKPTIPKSIAGARGSGAGVTQPWAGPRSLDEILSR